MAQVTRGRSEAPDAAGAQPRKKRLGKGLSALLGEYLPDPDAAVEAMQVVPVSQIAENPFQPRREFSEEQLRELESSVRENGLLQPLVVRPLAPGAAPGMHWELVAGERRLRVVRRLGWAEVPVVVKQVDDRAMLLLAIVENIQRSDLSPLEEAAGYRQLMDDFGLTQKEVAEGVGRDRSTVANLMRLLHLPASVQRLVTEQKLSMGHARALLGLDGERRIAEMAREVVKRGLSVRQTEGRVRQRRRQDSGKPRAAKPKADAHLQSLERELQREFGTAVRVRVTSADTGHIEIPFFNTDDFDRVMEILLAREGSRS